MFRCFDVSVIGVSVFRNSQILADPVSTSFMFTLSHISQDSRSSAAQVQNGGFRLPWRLLLVCFDIRLIEITRRGKDLSFLACGLLFMKASQSWAGGGILKGPKPCSLDIRI